MNDISIIVARYNESLSWTLEFPFNQFKYIVYNKGDNENFIKDNVNSIINLPNIGRCDHTYLYHIIKNYHNLPNINIFFPGSLDEENKKKKAYHILTNIINSNFQAAYFVGNYKESLKQFFNDFQLDEWQCTNKENLSKNNEIKLQKCVIRPYGKWYQYFFNNTPAHWISMWGVFSIDKRDIIQHPINRYEILIQTVNKSSNPEAGHYLERSWGAVFYPLMYTNKILE